MAPAKIIPATAQELREVLHYDSTTGEFGWIGSRRAGKSAGQLCRDGYVRVNVFGISFYAHRLAWLYVHGEQVPADREIDHVDGNRANNRIENLRLATISQQRANISMKRTNTSGFKGIHQNRRSGNWVAAITKDRKVHRLGTFYTPEEAHAAYAKAAMKLFGEFARAV